MTRFYLDTEFNGFKGELISLALVREDGASVYIVWPRPANCDPWVEKNVLPLIERVPPHIHITDAAGVDAAELLQWFIGYEKAPIIISDWPDDIRYLSERLITGPGEMITSAPRLRFEVQRVDAYPTKLLGAIQHNAWWDAMALRARLTGKQATKRRTHGEESLHAGPWVRP